VSAAGVSAASVSGARAPSSRDDGRRAVPAFSLRQVEQSRGDVRILRAIDLDIPVGEVVAVVGPSGAGKTSLIRLLNRLDDPASGTVTYRGAPIESIPVRQLRRRVAFVFQSPVMFAGTVAENLALGRDLARAADGPPPTSARRFASLPFRSLHYARGQAVRSGSGAALDGRPAVAGHAIEADEALRIAGLDPALASRDAASLSGGERQRVSIARALTTGPDALLLDEPTSALDPEVADHILATVRALAGTMGLTVVLVTHRLEEARAASTHTVFMEAGHVIEAGPTETMFTTPYEARTRDYLLRRS
jgi:ABC-type methionine transport system ATPase subunit